MKVLIACEYSARIRDAFRRRGFDAWSCDILPTEGDPQYHFQMDVNFVLWELWHLKWDLLIAHPPCQHLAASGAQYWPEKQKDGRQEAAIKFFMALHNAPVQKVCIENPVGIIGTIFRKADQIIQPWQFGEPYNKKTCFWLKGLPPLKPTNIIAPTHNWGSNSFRSGARKKSPLPSIHWGEKERSRTFQGIADAMAAQWGVHDL